MVFFKNMFFVIKAVNIFQWTIPHNLETVCIFFPIPAEGLMPKNKHPVKKNHLNIYTGLLKPIIRRNYARKFHERSKYFIQKPGNRPYRRAGRRLPVRETSPGSDVLLPFCLAETIIVRFTFHFASLSSQKLCQEE